MIPGIIRLSSPVLAIVFFALPLAARTMLFDFETNREVKAWHDEHQTGIGGGKTLDRSGKFAVSGEHALRVDIPAWLPEEHDGRFLWPAFECKPPIADWSKYDRLVFDVTNVTAGTQRLMMFVSDSKHATRSGTIHRLALPPFGHVRATVNLREEFRKKHLSLADVHVMHIFTENPPVRMVAYLDAFQLLEPGETPVLLPTVYLRDFAALQRDAFATLKQSVTEHFSTMLDKAAAVPEEAGRVRRERDAALPRLDAMAALLKTPTPAVLDIPDQFARMHRELASRDAALDLAIQFSGIRSTVLAPNAQRRDVIAGFATSMEKIPPRRPGPKLTIADHAEVRLARNEYESVQLIVLPRDRALEHVKVQVSDLSGPGGAVFPGNGIETVLMGYVRTKHAPPYDSKAWVGWWPDPILDFLHVADIAKGDAQSFWIRVHAPTNQAAGEYRGTLTVTAGKQAAPLLRFRFAVRVYDFAVPRASPLPLAITFHPEDHPLPSTRKLQAEWRKSSDYPLNAWKKHRSEWAAFLADYYITMDSLYTYGGEGAPRFDLLDALEKKGRLGCFNLGYYGIAPLDAAGAAKWEKEQTAWLRPRYEKAKALGLLPHAYLYGCDEANKPLFPRLQRAAEIMKKIAPGVPIMTTARDASYGLKSGVTEVDWWCPLTPSYHRKPAAAARAAGKQVWWYICCGPGHPFANMFIEFPGIEGRLLMGAMTAKYRPDGFLYYQISIWNSKHSIEHGPFTDWDPRSWTTYHGDGSWTCAGPGGTPLPTIRLENFRDGLEDYAYYRLLEERVRAVRANPAPTQAAAAWLKTAEKLLQVPDEVVKSMREYTHSPEALYRWRHAMATAIETARAPRAKKE